MTPMAQPSAETQHTSSALRYLAVWSALVVLTATTYAVSRLDLGQLNFPIAMAIAVLKSSLVVVFFMHLLQHAPANRIVFATAFIFVALLMTFTLADLATRFPPARPPGPWFDEQRVPH
jgi:cytochrome c oxidase subunit IV